MRFVVALVVVAGVFTLGAVGGAMGLGWFVGVVVPYTAAAVFVVGIVYRIVGWAKVPVPFRIPTTSGQQQSLDWIPSNKLDNPSSGWGAAGRVALEVLCFRSLLRNTSARMIGDRLVYTTDLSLWAGAMAMHWSLLIILVRHLRLVLVPVPAMVTFVERVDGFLEIGLPVFFVTSVVFGLALSYLLVRRLVTPHLRYISLVGDYFALLVLLGVGTSGFLLRHVVRGDVPAIKELALGLVRFRPVVPESVPWMFFGHLFLVSLLLAYFPFSKLVHMPGVFLSPTRNLANNNRAVRHVNPWDYPVKVHSYEEYEDELREKMVRAGIPVERT
jgi:[DsrC]-trisulfide reductase subunit M